MLNRRSSKPMFKTSFWKLTTLSVLASSVLLIGITGRAQDSAKKANSRLETGIRVLGRLLFAHSRSEEWRLAPLREGSVGHEEVRQVHHQPDYDLFAS